MSLLSRILIDDAVDCIVDMMPAGKRLQLCLVSRQFNAAVKRNFLRHRRRIRIPHVIPNDILQLLLATLFPDNDTSPWVTNLDFTFHGPHVVQGDVTRLGAHLCRVTHLEVSHVTLPDQWAHALTSLQCLLLQWTHNVRDESLVHMTSLRSLQLRYSHVTTDAALSRMEALTSLHMVNCPNITGSCFPRLRQLENLIVLDDMNVRCEYLSSLQRLSSLYMWKSLLTGSELLRASSSLTSLELSYCHNFQADTLLHLTALQELSLIHIDNNHRAFTASSFSVIARSLVHLDVSYNAQSVSDEFLAQFCALGSLHVEKCTALRNPVLSKLASTLTLLYMSECVNLQTATLSTLTRLECLIIAGCIHFQQDELIAALIVNATSLQSLNIDDCIQFTDELVPHLATLRHVDADNVPFTLPLPNVLSMEDVD